MLRQQSDAPGLGALLRGAVALTMLLGTLLGGFPALADMAAAEKWVNNEFQPSTLSKADQMKEMAWFI